MSENESFATEVSLNVPSEVKPFQTTNIKMFVKADLIQTKDNSFIEHRVSIEL